MALDRIPSFPFDIPRQILDGLGEGVSLADADGRIVFSNRAADRILGVPATDAPPEEWAEYYGVFLPEDRTTPFPADRYPLVRALDGEESVDVEMWIRNPNVPDGALIAVTGRPLRDDEGRVAGAAVVFRDVTALREAQTRLERTNARLEEVQRHKDELSAFVVHDLKSPVTGILLGSDMLLSQDVLRGDALATLRDIRESAATLHRMILDLLDIRLAQEGRLEPRRTSIRLGELLHDVARALRIRAGETRATITVDEPADDVEARADPELLRRVVQNLADNCLKYTPRGRVTMGARPVRDSAVLVHVEDDGPGVPPELRDEIFQMWSTAERDDSGRHRDSRGIGLRFCRLAVEAHGGRIWVEDAHPRGARFCVELPQGEDGGASTAPRTSTAP